MGLKKSNSNSLVIFSILFAFLTMITVDAAGSVDRTYKTQLQTEYDNYFDEYVDLTKEISQIDRDFREDTLIRNNDYANAKMLARDIKILLDRYLVSDLATKDILLVDIGFNLSLMAEDILKLKAGLY